MHNKIDFIWPSILFMLDLKSEYFFLDIYISILLGLWFCNSFDLVSAKIIIQYVITHRKNVGKFPIGGRNFAKQWSQQLREAKIGIHKDKSVLQKSKVEKHE